MEAKSNDATYNRPEGARLIDAPVIKIDLQDYTRQIKEEHAWKKSDHNAITVFKTDSMRIVLIALHAGSEIIRHVAEDVMSVQVLEGDIHFNVEGHKHEIAPGQIITLHKGYNYSIQAVQESTLLLTMSNSVCQGL